ncbi:hypothetical protein DW1_0292 [Proteiniborus sp. DW1]|uniref:hypothetical protein n=1 Tax=Proteiniborus sp. DW1 TaxID=1889883 RepID=UPI00092E1B9B|nr:hypothetical protein [Proteiniborus sp. DW1]SCG81912.1 hypothetical protein DW1_0292 [Proteiniborus sp. DW1]
MKVYILDKVIEYNNDKSSIESMFQEIDNILDKSNRFFSHLLVDGLEVYGDYYDYFIDNIRNIKEVKVVASTLTELVQNIMISTVDYINRAIPEVDILSNEFYKTPSEQSWAKFSDLLEGIAWIMDSFNAIDTNGRLKELVSSYEEWNNYAKDIYSLHELLRDLEEVMKNQDTVSMGDILSYEINPLLKNIKEKLEGLVSKGAS